MLLVGWLVQERLEALARHLAVELTPRGIRVNILTAGAVLTDAWKAMPNSDARIAETLRRTLAGRLATAEEIAYGVKMTEEAALVEGVARVEDTVVTRGKLSFARIIV